MTFKCRTFKDVQGNPSEVGNNWLINSLLIHHRFLPYLSFFQRVLMMLCLYARDELVRNSWVITCFCRKDLALIPRVTPNWVFCLVVAVWTEICVALVLQNGLWRARGWLLLNDWISFISTFFQKYFPLIFFLFLFFFSWRRPTTECKQNLYTR